MPELEENITYWERDFHWRHGGDEWSDWWGSPEAQWRATVWPRVRAYLPAQRAVEIAPGFGRWTEFLREHCDELIGVDVAEKCVKACRRRFRRDRRLTFFANDGRSLPMVASGCAGFVFSFDSLVHVERDVMDAYVREVARILRDDGVAFLHHSNMAGYDVGRHLPHWRSGSVSAETVAATASEVGLSCFAQELVPWGNDHDYLSDAFTWVARAGSRHDHPREVVTNEAFMDEAARAQASA